MVTFRLVALPITSRGACPARSIALASSVTASSATAQRGAQRGDAEQLRRLRAPHRGAIERHAHPPIFAALERVGQRNGEQATAVVGADFVDQSTELLLRQAGTRRVVHEYRDRHRRCEPRSRSVRCGHSLRATRRRPAGTRPARRPALNSAQRVSDGATTTKTASMRPSASMAADRMLQHRAVAERQVLLRNVAFAHARAHAGGRYQGDVTKGSGHGMGAQRSRRGPSYNNDRVRRPLSPRNGGFDGRRFFCREHRRPARPARARLRGPDAAVAADRRDSFCPGPAARLRRRPAAGSQRRAGARGAPPAGHHRGRRARCAAPGRRDPLLRADAGRAAAAGLGDAAVRHAVAAPGPGVGASRDAVSPEPGECGIDVLVVPATTALYRLAPPQYIAGHTFFFRQGQTLDADELRTRLVFAGYSTCRRWWRPGSSPSAAA